MTWKQHTSSLLSRQTENENSQGDWSSQNKNVLWQIREFIWRRKNLYRDLLQCKTCPRQRVERPKAWKAWEGLRESLSLKDHLTTTFVTPTQSAFSLFSTKWFSSVFILFSTKWFSSFLLLWMVWIYSLALLQMSRFQCSTADTTLVFSPFSESAQH